MSLHLLSLTYGLFLPGQLIKIPLSLAPKEIQDNIEAALYPEYDISV